MSSEEEEIITDDYFVLEGDISSTGGYITLMRFFDPPYPSTFIGHFVAFLFPLIKSSQKSSKDVRVTVHLSPPEMRQKSSGERWKSYRRNKQILLQN